MKKIMFIFTVSLFIISCASVEKGHNKINVDLANNEITKKHLIEKYGQPDSYFMQGNHEVLAYDYSMVKISGGKLIPIISPYMRSYKYINETVYFYIDKTGKAVGTDRVKKSGSFPPARLKELKQ